MTRRVVAIAVTALMIAATSFSAGRVSGDDRAPIPGNTPPFVQTAQRVGHTSEKAIDFVVGLKLRNREQLVALLDAQQTPGSPEFGRYLTPVEFTARFGPSDADVAAVVGHLRANGLRVREVAPNRLLVTATGSVGAVEHAFGLQIEDVAYRGATYYANTSDPIVPVALAGVVDSVIGLDNFTQLHPSRKPADVQPAAAGEPSGYSPQQIATAYNFTGAFTAGYTGAGQAIAIATAFTYQASDVNFFWTYYGITPPAVINIPVGGTTTQTDVETTLDLERAGAMAPGATIRMYLGVNNYISTFTDIFNRIVTDNVAKSASTSWGTCEQNYSPATLSTDNAIFQQAAAQGITFFAASGDRGAYDCNPTTLSVNYPGSDPYVSSTGGTTLTLNTSDGSGGETGWSGSGGGPSVTFEKPSWQTGLGDSKRDAADVALNADPATGYPVYYNGGWSTYGGTSFAAPQWAAIAAIVNQYRGSLGPLGYGNLAFYRLGTTPQTYPPYRDVTSGSNGYYSAGAGWDYVTGWGSVDVWNLVRDLGGMPAPTPTPTATPTPTPTNSPTTTSTPTSMSPTPTGTGMPTVTRTATTTPTVPSPPANTATPTATSTAAPPGAPTNLRASTQGRRIALSWTASPTSGVTYNVYRGTVSQGESLYARGVSSAAFSDRGVASGTTYYYYVRAVDSAGRESTASNEASARAR